MRALVVLLFTAGLFQASSCVTYDEVCFYNYSQTFPKDPVVKAEQAQVEILQRFRFQGMWDDEVSQIRSRRREVLNRGQESIFQYSHPDTPYPRNLTLLFDGSTVFSAMAAYIYIEPNEPYWECISSSDTDFTFRFYDVSYFKFLAIKLKVSRK